MSGEKSTDDLIKDLLSSVAALQKDVTALKTKEDDHQKRKRLREENEEEHEADTNRDGERHTYRQRNCDSNADEAESGDEMSTESKRFKLSEEGEAFLETVFGSRLEYATRKAKAAKYGQPDSKWAMCPELSPVVAAMLPKEAVKNDKVAFRTQQLWTEAAGPLTACLEKAHEGQLTIQEAILMIQSALVLMGDAAQHQAALRRKSLLQRLNPQLQSLMKESDFKEAQPYLFGEDYAEKAKCKLEAAAALRKSVYLSSTKGKSGFRGSHPRKNWGRQGGRVNTYAPGKSKRDQGTSSKSEKTSK